MKILSAGQIREADAYTISNEPINSIDLMERAARSCVDWMQDNLDIEDSHVHIFCGVGNNGGDGLVIARLLADANIAVSLYILTFSKTPSKDFSANLDRIDQKKIKVSLLKDAEFDIEFTARDLIVDAIFGTGLKRSATDWVKEVIKKINFTPIMVLSIDIPSGLFTDFNEENDFDAVVKADYTLTFQQPKLALVLPTSGAFCGEWHVLDIGLDADFIERQESDYHCFTNEEAWLALKEREKYNHKGNFGHALLVCGSKGKIGAAVLASKACLRSGIGLLTTLVPACGYSILQSAVPEAMCLTSTAEEVIAGHPEDLSTYDTIGIGPGIGTEKDTIKSLKKIISMRKDPLVLDADALNILSLKENQLESLPENSILTPHPGEFRRLAGDWNGDKERLQAQKSFSKSYKVIVVLKGAHTSITSPDGKVYFNTTGNPGMATAGSGDVLLGIITALLARSYEPIEAARLGVYLHGLAGDIAAIEMREESMLAGDIIDALPAAFLSANM